MPIQSITQQPAPGIRAAYNPHIIEVRNFNLAPVQDPVVFFDVYINGTYYKTLTSTTPKVMPGHFRWSVDVKDALQEYLASQPPLPLTFAGNAYAIKDTASACTFQVFVRGSTITAGVISPGGPVPVQATFNSPAVAGGGFASNIWLAVNVALQQEQDQRLNFYLQKIPHFQLNGGTFLYPLSLRQRLEVTPADYGFFPFLADYQPYGGNVTGDLRLRIVTDTAAAYTPTAGTYATFNEAAVYYVPIGPQNLAGMAWTPAGVPGIFQTAIWYEVQLLDNNGDIYFKTPRIYLKRCAHDYKRIHFINSLGHFEAVNFGDFEEATTVSSKRWEQSLGAAPTMGTKSLGGVHRFNVRSNERTTILGWFEEQDMQLIKELQTTTAAFLELRDSTQGGVAADYLPIVILDADQVSRKWQERHVYETTLTFEMAHPNIHLRN